MAKNQSSSLNNKCDCCNAVMVFHSEEDRDYLHCEYCGNLKVLRMKTRPAPAPVYTPPQPQTEVPEPQPVRTAPPVPQRNKTNTTLWVCFGIGFLVLLFLGKAFSIISPLLFLGALILIFGKGNSRSGCSTFLWVIVFLYILGSIQ